MLFDDVYQLLVETRFYNSQLNKKFWRKAEFDSDIRDKLLKIVDDFVSDDLKPLIDDIQLTGSLANFNYTKYSDLDVHILLDYSKINDDTDLVKGALDGKRFIWNLRHSVVIRKHEVELYYQDTNEPHIASGLYSLLDDVWIREPKFNPPEIDENDVAKKAIGIADTVSRLKEVITSDITPSQAKLLYNKAKALKTKIGNMRRAGLKKHGEFAVENLAFKTLRNEGSIGDLIDIISISYDKIYSEQATIDEDLFDVATKLSDKLPKMDIKGNEVKKFNKVDPNTKFHLGHGLRGLNRKTQKFISDVHRVDGSLNKKIEVLKTQPGKFTCNLSDAKYIQKHYVPDLFVNPPSLESPKQLNRTEIKIFYDDGKNLFYIERA